MAHVALRLAQPADGELIAALIAEHTANEGATALGRPEDYARGLADGAYECLVAERRGTALGLAMFYPTFSSWRDSAVCSWRISMSARPRAA